MHTGSVGYAGSVYTREDNFSCTNHAKYLQRIWSLSYWIWPYSFAVCHSSVLQDEGDTAVQNQIGLSLRLPHP
ncbi:hypothetical protein M378DRAFT_547878 [Amanita muscaria Koide BX008]|uniref:Uncharacterized protein n=1 Tax=Amanita muscaria (strain Koide BX008) TaxID=946122 RepID=A0A0C2WIV0_AMAMK|nr:hypothetical protein M378DRAFT_547878 [Amanita muscaria Koide BX008]